MRASGILLPISALPSKYGIGCFDACAFTFIDQLKKAKQTYWQILPLGPTSYGDSPYQSFSTFAGNPYFISLDTLVEKGLLSDKEIRQAKFQNKECIDYEDLYEKRKPILYQAYQRSNFREETAFHQFREENADWLYDYTLFMAVKDFFEGVSWDQWPQDIRMRYGYSMDYYRDKLQNEIAFYEFVQYEFYLQWQKVKNYANENGISIIGDIPIYVAYDSADTWANPHLFQLDENNQPIAVAGCPPDGFSATGQLWGNPLYRWDVHKESQYAWWKQRMKKCYERYDVVRIDHFRGFDEYYAIPYEETTAMHGHWEKGPGLALFQELQRSLPEKEVIAEDLGYLTDSVRDLVKDCGYPGMKVLEFAFDSRDSSSVNDYLPHNYTNNCVVYTGTHDNETMMGWFQSILPEEKKALKRYLNVKKISDDELLDQCICLIMGSVAKLCIIPMQDWLGLDNHARMNIPSTLGNNWVWRMKKKDFSAALIRRIARISETYGRI